ncbi:hypothetical protein RCL1_001854 [Eukaryota sp. TZLM3-RCL]
MGVPRFFRWVAERYPLILTPIALDEGLEFDCLYLDFNGVIHACSHPASTELTPTSEREMFLNIFSYIELLFSATKPQKLVYIAIDGVAPRAKMNQQRSRRFRSAKEAQDLRDLKLNDVADSDSFVFDTNAITPGTDFMERLSNHLQYFLINKINSDSNWRNIDVVFSGCEVPGEGEHKIMDYIRKLKAQPDCPRDLRHCIYGLDADLIFLALVTHEPNFCILREEVKFGKTSGRDDAFNPNLQFVHIALLREYLGLEFEDVKNQLTFEFDLERIVDDFVLLCMLVGNDFVPSLPTLDIAESSLDLIMSTYTKLLPTFNDYIHYSGEINFNLLKKLLRALVPVERKILIERVENEKVFTRSIRQKAQEFSTIHEDVQLIINQLKKTSVETIDDPITEDTVDLSADEDVGVIVSDGEGSTEEIEGGEWKVVDYSKRTNVERKFGTKNFLAALAQNDDSYRFAYYIDKFGLNSSTEFENFLPNISRHYCSALIWILGYYYSGVIDWSWYYPYHYAPLLSDLPDFLDSNPTVEGVKFDFSSTPLRPLEQLVAVLPRLSSPLLPSPYAELINEGGLLAQYYPEDFETDQNGKKNPWEAIVIIPIIDHDVLTAALATVDQSRLSIEHRARNQTGSAILLHSTDKGINHRYNYHLTPGVEVQPPSISTSWLTPFVNQRVLGCFYKHPNFPLNISKCSNFVVKTENNFLKNFRFSPTVDREMVRHALFPTFYHDCLKFSPIKSKENTITVFQHTSKKQSTVISLEQNTCLPEFSSSLVPLCPASLTDLLGSIVYVGWPHLRPALVERIEDVNGAYSRSSGKNVEQADPYFNETFNSMTELLYQRWGISFDSSLPRILIYTRRCKAMAEGNLTFDRRALPSPWIMVLTTLPKTRAGITSSNLLKPLHSTIEKKTLEEVNVGEYGISLKKNHFSFGQLVTFQGKKGPIFDVNVLAPPMVPKLTPNFYPSFYNLYSVVSKGVKWYYLNQAATKIGMSVNALNKVIDHLMLDETYKIGLSLRRKWNYAYVPGYSATVVNQSSGYVDWILFEKSILIVSEYRRVFPELFAFLNRTKNLRSNNISSSLLFSDVKKAKQRIKAVSMWLMENAYHLKHQLVPHYCNEVDKETVRKMEEVMVKSFEVQYKMPPGVASPVLTSEGFSVSNLPVTETCQGLSNLEVYFPGVSNNKLQHFFPAIGDRVVHIGTDSCIPFGSFGVVIAVKQLDQEACDADTAARKMAELASDREIPNLASFDEIINRTKPLAEMDRVEVEVMWSQVHLGASNLRGRLSDSRGSRVDATNLINLTKPPAVVVPSKTIGPQYALYQGSPTTTQPRTINLTAGFVFIICSISSSSDYF